MFRSRGSRRPRVERRSRHRPLGVESLEARHLLSAVGLASPAPTAHIAPHSAAAPAAAIGGADVDVPGDFSGTPLSGSTIDLTWTADGSALGYLIYEFEGSQAVQIGQTNGSTGFFGVSGLAPGSTYAFNLVAFDASSSGATDWISVGTLAGIPAPGNFTGGRLSDTQVQLSWTASAGATGYQLYEFANNQPTLINTLGSTATGTTVSNLMANTNYSFNLVAFDAIDSSATPWITVSTATLVPPANFAGSALSSTQVQLTWTNSVAASGYDLFEFIGGQPVLVTTYGTGASSGVVSGLSPSTTYAFNLVAVNSTGTAASAWIGVTTFAPLAPPANFTGTGISSSQVNLQWSLAAGATGYNLYQFESGSPVLIATLSASQTSDPVTGLNPSTAYAFNLVAFNATESAATSWISVSTTA